MSLQEEINKAGEVLKRGGVILYPTDTVWGLGCDAGNPQAIKKIHAIKKRAENKAMIVLLDNPYKLNLYVEEVPELAWNLIELSDKPLTIIYRGAKNLAANEGYKLRILATGEGTETIPLFPGCCFFPGD
jgi:L-threonylcarbamoyladenylate synthase